jgi:hypothetical protein
MTMDNEIDWRDIGKRLAEPFNPADVDYRVQGKAGAGGKAQAVAYIDARTVQDRLDAVVGPGNWSFDWTPVVVEKGDVQVAKGTLTIYGVSKSDAGSASNFEQSLGAVSHCFKRAAVHWGIGRYLYGLPMAWVPVEGNGRIADATLRELRSRLPRPQGQPAATASASTSTHAQADTPPTDAQWTSIRKLCDALGVIAPDATTIHTSEQARERISTLTERYKARQATPPATPPATSAPTTAPASLHAVDMNAHAAAVATEAEQARLVDAIKAKGFRSANAVAGLLGAHLDRTLDVSALAKHTSDITNGEVRTLTQALEAIRAPRQTTAAAAQAKPAATPA